MEWFDRLGLRAKLLLNFGLCGGVLILAIVFNIVQIQRLSQVTEDLAGNWLPSTQAAGKISQERLRYRVRSLEYMLPGTPEEKDKIEKSLGKLDEDLAKVLVDYQPLITGPQEQAIIDDVKRAVATYREVVLRGVQLAKAGNEEEAQALRKKEWVAAANALRDQTDKLSKFNREGAEAAAEDARRMIAHATTGGLSALAIGVLIAVLLSLWFAQRMARQLDTAAAAARRIASGDLRETLPPAGQDEVGRLVGAMGEMQESLHATLEQTQHNADQVSDTAHQLSESVDQMELSASRQSSSAAAIAANIQQLTVSINHVKDNTLDASQLASHADQRAREGREAVERALVGIRHLAELVSTTSSRISELENQSTEISNIVGVIKAVAEQTNLLALNAAIEAARAGEHGRGFAVVADEVRQLSERTAQSTGEITRMIDAVQASTREAVNGIRAGVSSVDQTVTLTSDAGAAIAELQEIAQRVSELVNEIATSLKQQSSASNDVARKVEDIAALAEETSAATTEASAAANALERVAGEMRGVVGRFQL